MPKVPERQLSQGELSHNQRIIKKKRMVLKTAEQMAKHRYVRPKKSENPNSNKD